MAKRKSSKTLTFDKTLEKKEPEAIQCDFEPTKATAATNEPTLQVNFRLTRKAVDGLNVLTALGGFRTKGALLGAMTQMWVEQKGAEIPAEIKKKFGF